MMQRTVHTADLTADELTELEAFLFTAFDDYHAGHWEHALGGLHVLVSDPGDGSTVGHACVVMRRMLHGDVALRCGYVESVATHREHRRKGIGDALMTEVGRILAGAYDLGALGATEDGARLYARHGWVPWDGELHALTPDGVRATPQDLDHVRVLEGAVPLDRAGSLTCDWRDGDLW